MQFEFALRTREMVRELIRRAFSVAMSVLSAGRLLRKLGMPPQRPCTALISRMLKRPDGGRTRSTRPSGLRACR